MPPPPSYGGGSRRGKASIGAPPISDHGAERSPLRLAPSCILPRRRGRKRNEAKRQLGGKHMSGQSRPSRRAMLKVGLAGAATVASPAILRLSAEAQTGPIKI